MRKNLPSTNSLVALDAISRHKTFRAASEELCTSRNAVSHQLKSLENFLGIQLLSRKPNGMEFTKAGEEVHSFVRKSLQNITATVHQAQKVKEKKDKTVKILISGLFSTHWLSQKLSSFFRKYPGICLEFETSDCITSLANSKTDCAILFGKGKWDIYHATKLFPDLRYFPVSSPSYMDSVGMNPIGFTKEKLANLNLLIYENDDEPMQDWTEWFLEMDFLPSNSQKFVKFDSYDNALNSAIFGGGIAIGWDYMVDELLTDGKLIRIGNNEARINSECSFYFLHSENLEMSPECKFFYKWLSEEIGQQSAFK